VWLQNSHIFCTVALFERRIVRLHILSHIWKVQKKCDPTIAHFQRATKSAIAQSHFFKEQQKSAITHLHFFKERQKSAIAHSHFFKEWQKSVIAQSLFQNERMCKFQNRNFFALLKEQSLKMCYRPCWGNFWRASRYRTDVPGTRRWWHIPGAGQRLWFRIGTDCVYLSLVSQPDLTLHEGVDEGGGPVLARLLPPPVLVDPPVADGGDVQVPVFLPGAVQVALQLLLPRIRETRQYCPNNCNIF